MSRMQEVPTDELLSFQDFPPVHNLNNSTSYSASTVEVDLQKAPEDIRLDNSNPSFRTESEESDNSAKSFWTIEYYQKYFDVDTQDVVERLVASVIPTKSTLLKSYLKTKPDLYGPFWVSITLIFTIAISGNVANYLQHANESYHWKYNFHLVSYAATTITFYVCLIPLSLWAVIKWSEDPSNLEPLDYEDKLNPLELVCVYGYSLFVYIPVSVLWTIQVGWFQWLLVATATLLSGSVLVYTLMPSLRQSRYRFMLTFGVMLCHLLLASGLMLCFFYSNTSNTSSVPATPAPVATILNRAINATLHVPAK